VADADVTVFLYHETARCSPVRIDAEVSEAANRDRWLAAGWGRGTLDPKAIASDADMQLECWGRYANADVRVGGSTIHSVDTPQHHALLCVTCARLPTAVELVILPLLKPGPEFPPKPGARRPRTSRSVL